MGMLNCGKLEQTREVNGLEVRMKVKIGIVSVLTLTLLLTTLAYGSPLDEEIQKLKQAGIPTTIEELNLPEIPDSENAAFVYQKIFELMEKNKEDMVKIQSVSSYSDITKWTEEQKKEIPLLVDRNKEIYELLAKATTVPKCRFAIKYEDGPGMLLPHLSKLRSCARLLAVKGILEARDGKTEEGMNTFIMRFKLSRSLSNEPILISQLVRIAINSITLSSLEEVLNKGDFDNKTHESLIAEVRRERKSHLISLGLKGEILCCLWSYNRISKSPIEDTFRLFQVSVGMSPPAGYTTPPSGTHSVGETDMDEETKKLVKEYLPFAENDIVFYLETISKLISLTKKSYWQVKDELKEIEKSVITLPKEKYLLSTMGLPTLFPADVREARSDALLGAAELGLANRIYRQKHGKFADSLNQLTPEILSSLPLDPFTGKNYIYRLKDKGFIVYSVADNLKDDGGISQFSEQGKKGDYDIVWEDSGTGSISQLFPNELVEAANRTFSNYVHSEEAKETKAQGDIPPKYWTASIRALKPIRVYLHRINVVVVQRVVNGVEEGKYIYIPVSSYLPMSGDDGFTFTPNPLKGNTYDTGDGIFDFQRK
jgi:hypothetical protein